MIWVLVSVVLIVVAAQLWSVLHREPPGVSDDVSRRAAVGLFAIRRRLEVADYKREVRRGAARAWRELRDELDEEQEAR